MSQPRTRGPQRSPALPSWARWGFEPWLGCQPVSIGCENCTSRNYAALAAATDPLAAQVAEWIHRPTGRTASTYEELGVGAYPRWTRKVVESMTLNTAPDHWRPGDVVAVCWQSDPFVAQREQVQALWGWLAFNDRQRYVLTSRRLSSAPKGLELLPHVMLGASAADGLELSKALADLQAQPAAARCLVLEPLVDRVDLAEALELRSPENPQRPLLDWVLVGGETGRSARFCELDWLRLVVDQCKGARVPVYVQQLGSRPSLDGQRLELEQVRGADPRAWPVEVRVQEFPRGWR